MALAGDFYCHLHADQCHGVGCLLHKFRLHINYALQYSKGSKKDICGSGVRCNGTLKAEMVGFRTLRSSKREGEVERRHLTETQDSCTRPQNSGSRTLSNPVFHNLEKPGRPASSPDPPGALTPQAVDRSLAFCVKARLAASRLRARLRGQVARRGCLVRLRRQTTD